MPRQIICTVGTSLLTNRDRRPWSGWSPRSNNSLPDAGDVDAWLRNADVAEASAETNTLSRLDLSPKDTLILLHSDTLEGSFCAQRLQTFYCERLRAVEIEKIGSLGYSTDNFSSGLKALINIVITKERQGRNRGMETLLCATGGFKAEIAFLNLLGALLGIEVVYIHELHRDLVRLPRLPLEWNADFVIQHREFFQWINTEPRKSTDVESWLRGNPELRLLVEDCDDGTTCLSAAGDLLYRVALEKLSMAPRAVWPKADPRPPREKNHLSGVEHHRPDGWERFVERLCAIDCVTSVRYAKEAHGSDRVKILDGEKGVIGLVYGVSGKVLPLRVETTARGQEQTELVERYLRSLK